MTLVEVMIVVVIIGILSSIAIPTYISSREKAKIAATVAEIKILEKMIQAYNIDNDSYPETIEDIGMQRLKDPWGNPYLYLSPGLHGEMDVYTLGADGLQGGTDKNADIGNWDVER